MAELRRRVGTLPDSTAILDHGIIRDESGARWVPLDATDRLRPLQPRADHLLERPDHRPRRHWRVGLQLRDIGQRAGTARPARAGGRVRRCDPANRLRALPRGGRQPRAEAPRHTAERRLPATAELRFRQASLLEEHGRWLLAGALLLLLQTALILGLLASRRQRRQAQQELEENLRIGRLVAAMEAAFREVKPEQLDEQVDTWLERLARTLDAERAALSLISPDGGMLLVVPFRWAHTAESVRTAAEPAEPSSPHLRADRRRPCRRLLAHRRQRAAGHADRAFFTSLGTRSFVLVPLFHEATALGCLTFSTVTRERAWPLGLVSELQLAAGIFAAALGREREAKAALKDEAFTSAMIATAASRVAIVDRRGVLVRVSEAWQRRRTRWRSPSSRARWARTTSPAAARGPHRTTPTRARSCTASTRCCAARRAASLTSTQHRAGTPPSGSRSRSSASTGTRAAP